VIAPTCAVWQNLRVETVWACIGLLAAHDKESDFIRRKCRG